MMSQSFRPVVDGLEDRAVPSVTPFQVLAAFTHTQVTTDELQDLTATLKQPRTTQTIQFLGTHLRQAADASKTGAAVLADYLNELRTQMAANPALAASLTPVAGMVGYAEYQALINAAYADVYATAFGVPPPVPPPPPPENSAPDFGSTGSTLPFSLNDPNFQPASNGVRIWDVTQGSGTAVQVNDQITVNYTGYLTDGTVFDSSAKQGQPLSTTLNTSNLIPGFVTGITGMKPGGTRRIDIPASQAYGSNPPSGIPANAELVFEVTLVSSP